MEDSWPRLGKTALLLSLLSLTQAVPQDCYQQWRAEVIAAKERGHPVVQYTYFCGEPPLVPPPEPPIIIDPEPPVVPGPDPNPEPEPPVIVDPDPKPEIPEPVPIPEPEPKPISNPDPPALARWVSPVCAVLIGGLSMI